MENNESLKYFEDLENERKHKQTKWKVNVLKE